MLNLSIFIKVKGEEKILIVIPIPFKTGTMEYGQVRMLMVKKYLMILLA